MEEESKFAVEVAEGALSRGCRRICLQLPIVLWPRGSMLSMKTTEEMRSRGCEDARTYLILSSSRSRCCVDAISADHADGELLVHVGPSCRSHAGNPGILHLDPPLSDDRIEELCKGLKRAVDTIRASEEGSGGCTSHLLIGIGWRWHRAAARLEASIEGEKATKMERHAEKSFAFEESNLWKKSGCLCWKMPPATNQTEDCHLLWLGEEDEELRALKMQHAFQSAWRWDVERMEIFRLNNEESDAIRRRHFYVEKAKQAQLIGVVVESVADAETRATVARIESMVSKAGKKVYVFVLSHVAPAKLANFPEVDVFVLVACPYTSLVDSKQYYAPVITVFEAEMAFKDIPWTGEYRFGLSSEAEGTAEEVPVGSMEGKGVAMVEMPISELANLDVETKLQSVVKERDISLVGSRGIRANSSSEFLSMRTYKGLVLEVPQDAGHEILEGMHGRAAHYQHEPKSHQMDTAKSAGDSSGSFPGSNHE